MKIAEHFFGRRYTVHTSNGGGESMLRAWILAAEETAPTQNSETVLTFLNRRLLGGEGCRAFSLNPPPVELATPDRLRFFAGLVAKYATELAVGMTDTRFDLCGDRQIELKWLAKMLDLYDIVADSIQELGETLPPLTPSLASSDQALCDYYRCEDQRADYYRRVSLHQIAREPRLQLEYVDRLLARLRLLEPSELRTQQTVRFLVERGELLLELGDRQACMDALHEALATEPAGEERQSLAEDIFHLLRVRLPTE